MKITRTEPLYSQPQAARKQEAPANQNQADQPRGDAKISTTAQSVAKARTLLKSTPDVDMNKVNQIRQAISEGRLVLDMDALGQAILDIHRR
ncbi:flagellar biosynthesis anti-sigma factor FlgM [Aeromonas australiensis]|uniref:flagellar biosynthesis anti-sigma factor FlgM n=1 Tax=Aeromonas australiensis TaxID=1114880 RepID=UPI001F36D459|nr:flagellar biosynthesis anti-sigma factor FlgM [Aeromonas australiensis]MCF3095904.1 flagellar biosynthesis anti-sigma factor FlgM [Aeromonas australiensis]